MRIGTAEVREHTTQLYPLTFRATVLEKNREPLHIDQIEFKGPLLTGQVLVKLYYSGICGKQLEEIDGSGGPDPFLPHLLGHEGSAKVIDVGPEVSKVKRDDTVVLHWRKGSGIQSETPLYYRNGERVNAGWVTTFNEYAVVSENRVTSISSDSDLAVAALCGCVVTTGVGAVFHAAKVESTDSVLVCGCGGVGLVVVQAAALKSVRHLIAVDRNDQALDLAHEFGATHLINSDKEDVIQRVSEITKGGASKVLICTGNPQIIERAMESTSIPGECFLIGVPPKGVRVHVDAHAVMHERSIRGALGGWSFPDRDIAVCLELYRQGRLRIDRLITCVGAFDDINSIIGKRQNDRVPGRCVVKF